MPRVWTERQTEAFAKRSRPPRNDLLFLGLTIVNPMTFICFSALVLSLLGQAPGVFPRLAFAAGAMAASMSWQLLLAVSGSAVHGRLPAGFLVATRIVGAAMILLFADAIAVAAFTQG